VARKIDLVVLADGKKRGPNLPPFTPFTDADGTRERWCAATRKWWNAWRTSPQSLQMQTDADWQFHMETAALHHQFWAHGRMDYAAELRLRQAKFGVTPEDRERQHIKVATSASTNPDRQNWSAIGASFSQDGSELPGVSWIEAFRDRQAAQYANDPGAWAEILAEDPQRSVDDRRRRLTKAADDD
jgi:hypothetical protein